MTILYQHDVYVMDWVIEGQLLYGRMWGEWGSQDMQKWDVEIQEMLEAARQRDLILHAIWDQSEVKKLASIQDYMRLEARLHPSAGWNVIINSPNAAQKFILSAATQLMKMRLRFVNSLDEAVDLLKSVDYRLETTDVMSAVRHVSQQQVDFLKTYPHYISVG